MARGHDWVKSGSGGSSVALAACASLRAMANKGALTIVAAHAICLAWFTTAILFRLLYDQVVDLANSSA
jgi:hypothetical protein